MPKIDHAAIAINAAGIADALAFLASEDVEAAARFERVAGEYGGHVGVMQQAAEAAGYMEQFRVKHGATAKWGGELPYLYDVWDAIAQMIWLKLDKKPLDHLVESAIRSVMGTEAVQ